MTSTQGIRIAFAIALTLFLGGLARAQNSTDSWLLQPPQASTRQGLDLSPVRIDSVGIALRAASRPTSPDAFHATQASSSPAATPIAPTEHRFWDTTNDLLFAVVGASRTLDYFSTLNMRRRGRDEILLTNDIVDNHAAFAVIEAAGTGASIGVSYLFHHYGHHRLERATSIVHIGLATTGAVRNYCLKTAHPPAAMPLAMGISR
jgi:hypothetical protein